MNTSSPSARGHAGFTLVELMIALVLGLILVGGVIGVFLFNRVTYRQNENLGRLQENSRQAFEVMGNELREAGGIACGSNLSVVNALTSPGSNWWSSWNDGTNNYNGVHGFESTDTSFPIAIGTSATDRVSGTDAVLVLTGTSGTPALITLHTPAAIPPAFTVNSTSHGFQAGDILMACDYGKAALFQAMVVGGASIQHDIGASPSPGNSGTLQLFQTGGQLAKLSANAWYVGYNDRGGKSLYRVTEYLNSGNAATRSEEIAEGISNLQIQYLEKDAAGNLASNYVDAGSIVDWTRVVAARVTFTLETLEGVGTDAQPITRTSMTVISLRNRSP